VLKEKKQHWVIDPPQFVFNITRNIYMRMQCVIPQKQALMGNRGEKEKRETERGA
jgi:hypothetical protein